MAMAEYSINHAVIADLMKNDPAVWAEVFAATEDAMEFWKSIAPVNKTGKPHKLPSGYVDEPGSYRDSIRMRMINNPTRIKGRVEAPDYKAHWLEHGSVHNEPPPEPMLHTLSYLRAQGFEIADNPGEEILAELE